MAENRIESYIGFAVRAGRIVYGGELTEKLRVPPGVILISPEAQKNTLKTAKRCSEKFSCPVIAVKNLGKILGRENCRICAVRDMSLSGAIISAVREYAASPDAGDGYKFYSED